LSLLQEIIPDTILTQSVAWRWVQFSVVIYQEMMYDFPTMHCLAVTKLFNFFIQFMFIHHFFHYIFNTISFITYSVAKPARMWPKLNMATSHHYCKKTFTGKHWLMKTVYFFNATGNSNTHSLETPEDWTHSQMTFVIGNDVRNKLRIWDYNSLPSSSEKEVIHTAKYCR